ncbi:MAG: hypothetical protein WC851_02720 [Candidatus Shapirobacteria bacterium]|jgi:hypothetical protein
MDSHKSTVLALSLSVLTLAVVSTFLSLNQSGVLGETTSAGYGGSVPPVKPTIVARPVESKICGEVKGLFNNYCLRGKDDQMVTGSADNSTAPGQAEGEQPFDARPDNGGLSGICGDLFKLTGQFCPTITGGPIPTSVCKYGVNNFSVGTACKTSLVPTGSKVQPLMYQEPSYTSAKYSCYDGKEGTVSSPNSSCVRVSLLKELARKACEGHSVCRNPEKPTGRPEEPKHCTGDKDCNDNETCLIPVALDKIGRTTSTDTQPQWLAFGRCVPKPKTTLAPRVTVNPKVTLVPTRTELSCIWCGTNCVAQRAGLKCPLLSAPAGKDCTAVGKACKIVDLKD